MTDWIILELWFIAFVNLVLWGAILILPPIQITVKEIRLFRLRPRAMAFLNLIIIRRDSETEPIIKHELEHVRQHRILSPFGLAIFVLIHYTYLWIKYRSFREVYSRSVLEKCANQKMYSSTPLPKNLIKIPRRRTYADN